MPAFRTREGRGVSRTMTSERKLGFSP